MTKEKQANSLIPSPPLTYDTICPRLCSRCGKLTNQYYRAKGWLNLCYYCALIIKTQKPKDKEIDNG